MPFISFIQNIFSGSPSKQTPPPYSAMARFMQRLAPQPVFATTTSVVCNPFPWGRTARTTGPVICAQLQNRHLPGPSLSADNRETKTGNNQPTAPGKQQALFAQLRRQAAFLSPSQMVQALEHHLPLTPKEKGLARAGMDSAALLDSVAQRLQ